MGAVERASILFDERLSAEAKSCCNKGGRRYGKSPRSVRTFRRNAPPGLRRAMNLLLAL